MVLGATHENGVIDMLKAGDRMVGGGLLKDGKLWSFATGLSLAGLGTGVVRGGARVSTFVCAPLHRRPRWGLEWIQ